MDARTVCAAQGQGIRDAGPWAGRQCACACACARARVSTMRVLGCVCVCVLFWAWACAQERAGMRPPPTHTVLHASLACRSVRMSGVVPRPTLFITRYSSASAAPARPGAGTGGEGSGRGYGRLGNAILTQRAAGQRPASQPLLRMLPCTRGLAARSQSHARAFALPHSAPAPAHTNERHPLVAADAHAEAGLPRVRLRRRVVGALLPGAVGQAVLACSSAAWV